MVSPSGCKRRGSAPGAGRSFAREARANVPQLTVQPDDSIFASGDQSKTRHVPLEVPHRPPRRHGDPAGGPARRPAAASTDRAGFFTRAAGRFLPERYLGPPWRQASCRIARRTSIRSTAATSRPPRRSTATRNRLGRSAAARGGGTSAVFVLQKPLDDAGELRPRDALRALLCCGLGRFRISVTTDPDPEARERPDDDRASADRRRRRADGRRPAAASTAIPHGAPELAEARRELDRACPHGTAVSDDAGHARAPAGEPAADVHPPPRRIPPADRARRAGRASRSCPPCRRMRRATGWRWPAGWSRRDNPLVARVTVNRQWAAFFGRGLVRTDRGFRLPGRTADPPRAARLARRRASWTTAGR